jgi:hypothetical protein
MPAGWMKGWFVKLLWANFMRSDQLKSPPISIPVLNLSSNGYFYNQR